jgi:RNA polymerase sigma-70 factor (ECF subfamily)
MSEGNAIDRLKGGDIGGLEVLVERYQVQAVRTAYLVCRDPALAEDIVQSAFLRAYTHIAQFDPTRPFGPWFLRIVVNDALKALRVPQAVLLDPSGLEEFNSDAHFVTDLEAHLEALETGAALSEAIAQLPPEQRAVIVLRYYLGFSDTEIATKLQRAPGTIRWRLHVARQRLRDLLPWWLDPNAPSSDSVSLASPSVAPPIEKENL